MSDSGGSARPPEGRVTDERWLSQTKVGGGGVPPEERGDCVPACIASVLGLPISAIGNTHGEGWWDRLQAEVGKHGYQLGCLDVKLEPPPGLWIASLPSLNLPADLDGKAAWHSVVAKGYEFVHDPSLGFKYNAESWAGAWNDDLIAEGWLLAPLDPAVDPLSSRVRELEEALRWMLDELNKFDRREGDWAGTIRLRNRAREVLASSGGDSR